MNYAFTQPLSMPRGSHYGSDYWISNSRKVNRKVHFYSMLEYYNFLCLEMDPLVEYFCEQPLKVSKSNDTKGFIFDFWVQFNDGKSELQEVKYSNELTGTDSASLRSQEQIVLQKAWCKINGFDYRIITDKDLLLNEHHINNLKRLQHLALRCSSTDAILIETLYSFLDANRNTTAISDIYKAHIIPNDKVIGILADQYYLGKIGMNISLRPLDYSTEVYLCHPENLIS